MKRVHSGSQLGVQLAGFVRSEAGLTAVEYAVLLALIVIVCLAGVTKVGNNANKEFKDVKKALKSGS